MNIKLLEKIKARILAEPNQFQMERWFTKGRGEIPNCGTAACIAGWALSLDKQVTPLEAALDIDHRFTFYIGAYHSILVKEKAANVLDISEEQANNLFLTNEWPEPYGSSYCVALSLNDKTKIAKIACDRIDYFIKTGL